jgi:hypothetical protein
MAQRSPFPGMDPWLESYWGTVHPSYIIYCRDQLAPQLPKGLFASVEETIYVVSPEWDQRSYRPDVAVISTEKWPQEPLGQRGTALVEPMRILVPTEPVPVRHIEIRENREGNPLVTAIEVVSPANKLDADGRAKYTEKRKAYYQADVNVVEIDLLRSGRMIVDVPAGAFSKRPDSDTPYKACVRAAHQEEQIWADYYPIPLRQRLPTIRIPLRPVDANLGLNLQDPLEMAYDRGGYWMRIDYSKPPEPPLSSDDALWARQLIDLIANKQ